MNQINKLKYHTTVEVSQSQKKINLNPNFVTGFADGESSFIILILREPKNKTGWTVKARFSIGLHKKDLVVLELIKSYFGETGNILKQGKDSVQYRVASLKDLTNVIIPHFNKYPLITQKKADFILFKKVVDLMNNKEHLTLEGLQKIIAFKASLNLGLSDELKGAFPDIVPIERSLVQDQKILDPYWLAGFTSGEGCFSVRIKKSSNFRLGFQVLLTFKLGQHFRDDQLMRSLIEYLGCGNVYNDSKTLEFIVTKYKDLADKVVPFFEIYKIEGVKFQDFQDFKKVIELMRNKDHLTAEGLDKIIKIQTGMNKGRNSI